VRIGILGGGLSGLTVATFLETEFEVLEKNPECGGLCRSLTEDGFTFDYGGAHIIYSRNQKTVEQILRLLGDNHCRGRRNNKIFYKDHLVKYPFENGLADLPKEDNFECLYHYLNNDYPKPSNFKEWIYHTFGKGIAERYLIPYNEKIWNTPAENMSLHWVEGRVPRPPLEDVLKSAIGISTEGYTHQLNYYYPRVGGIQALIKSLEEKLAGRITVGFQVRRIVKEKDCFWVSNGEEQKRFDLLVSCMPIFDLLGSLEDVPEEVTSCLMRLQYNSLVTVMLGLEQDDLAPYTALYFPNSDFKFNRVGFPKTFSSRNAPEGSSSVVAEITAREGDPTWNSSDGEFSTHVIDKLSGFGLIDPKKIRFNKVRRSKYAYVIYDRDFLSNVRVVREYVESLGILLCGRFAEFEYLNMDACVERGISLAKRINASRKDQLSFSALVKNGGLCEKRHD
jgi:protoporphyrinogen oxidase